MARNALETDPAREQRVRERAYHLWEVDGKPHGRDIEYWERARELISQEESADSAGTSNGGAVNSHAASPAPEKKAEPDVVAEELALRRKKSSEAPEIPVVAKAGRDKSSEEPGAKSSSGIRKPAGRKKK